MVQLVELAEEDKVSHYQHDIYYVKEPGTQLLADTLSIGGKNYFRFMDYIYIPSATEYLTQQQLQSVNDLRAALMMRNQIGSANHNIKELFSKLITLLNVNAVLEW